MMSHADWRGTHRAAPLARRTRTLGGIHVTRALPFRTALCLLPALLLGASTPPRTAARASSFQDLVAVFHDWRAFQTPKLVAGIPDYSAKAMSAQQHELPAYQARLTAIDTAGWPIAQKVDYVLVRAEMNGLDFDHRVKRPWARSPAFYVMFYPRRSDQPLREGPHVLNSIELWTFGSPLAGEKAAALDARLKTIPALLTQAKGNLVENSHDFWVLGIREMQEQSVALAKFATDVAASNPALVPDAQHAREATDQFVAWLQQQLPSKTGPSGIGVENYNWYLKNVEMVPYTWADEVALLSAELGRTVTGMTLEARHDRNLPPFKPIASADEYRPIFDAAVADYLAGLRSGDVLTVKSYMEPALRARGHYTGLDQFEFFNQVSDRDPILMLAHDFHWFDLAQMDQDPNPDPIRHDALLYNIFDSRTEGFASANEELMTDVGTYEGHGRIRELMNAVSAERCAVAMGDLKMASNEWTVDQAVEFAATRTPNHWLSNQSRNVWGADGEGLYLEQPTYGTSYTIGKILIMRLIGDRVREQGDAFTTKGFLDEFTSLGLIPVSLIRWQMTGDADEVNWMAGRTQDKPRVGPNRT